jgi:hypothetical protein
LLVSLCPVVRTADGADVDDGGAAVEIMAEGSAPVRLARIVGGCREIGQLAHHEVGRAECHDPHVDATHVVEVLRRDPRAVIVEVFAIDDNSQGRTPIAEQQIAVERTTRVHLTLGGACTIEPEPGR